MQFNFKVLIPHSFIHLFIVDSYIYKVVLLQVGLLRNAPKPQNSPNNVVLSCWRNFWEKTLVKQSQWETIPDQRANHGY